MSTHKQKVTCLVMLSVLAACGCSQSKSAQSEPGHAARALGAKITPDGDQNSSSPKDDPAPIDPTVQALIDGLSDTDGTVRRASAEGLRQRGDQAAVPALVKRVADDTWIAKPRFRGTNGGGDPEAGGKTAALEALRKLAPDKVPEALRQAQRSKNSSVRAWATQELSNP